MRVLTVVSDFGIGGTQRVAQNMTLGAQAKGLDVAVFAYGDRGPREVFYQARDVPIFHDAELAHGLAAAEPRSIEWPWPPEEPNRMFVI